MRPVSWRPLPAPLVGQTWSCGHVTAQGGRAVPAARVRVGCALHCRPRAHIPFQVGARRARPGHRLPGTAIGLTGRATREPGSELLAARLEVCAIAGRLPAADLSSLPACRVPIGSGQRFGPDALSAEFAQPVLGVFLVVAPFVRCLAIIPPPAHRYLHETYEAARTAARPSGCARTPPLSVKSPMRAEAPQPACVDAAAPVRWPGTGLAVPHCSHLASQSDFLAAALSATVTPVCIAPRSGGVDGSTG